VSARSFFFFLIENQIIFLQVFFLFFLRNADFEATLRFFFLTWYRIDSLELQQGIVQASLFVTGAFLGSWG
jgi:hypothetical protein